MSAAMYQDQSIEYNVANEYAVAYQYIDHQNYQEHQHYQVTGKNSGIGAQTFDLVSHVLFCLVFVFDQTHDIYLILVASSVSSQSKTETLKGRNALIFLAVKKSNESIFAIFAFKYLRSDKRAQQLL